MTCHARQACVSVLLHCGNICPRHAHLHDTVACQSYNMHGRQQLHTAEVEVVTKHKFELTSLTKQTCFNLSTWN